MGHSGGVCSFWDGSLEAARRLISILLPPPPDPNPAHHHQRPPAPHTPLPHPLILHLLSASLLPPASLDVFSGDLRPSRVPDKRRRFVGVARDSARSHSPRAPGRRREAHSYATANARATSGRLATRPSSAHNASELSHTAYPSHTLVVRATSFQGCLRPAAALDKAGAAGPLASPRRRRSADAAASPAEARGGTAIQPDLASTVIAPRAGTHSSPFPSLIFLT